MTWVTVDVRDRQKRNQQINEQKTIEVYNASAFILMSVKIIHLSTDELNAIQYKGNVQTSIMDEVI